MNSLLGGLALVLLLLVAAGCAAPPQELPVNADAVLLGEQHDASTHPQRHLDAVRSLAGRGRLAALALEMADVGTSTASLPPSSDEPAVRTALRWNDDAWPWERYGPVIMAAVRAGVPVLGANLPRAEVRQVMAEPAIDALLPATALKAQQQAIREGHCGLLPETQIGPMTRVQIARDRAMARTVATAAVPGKTVLLVAGAGHVDEALGVPQHLPPGLRWHAVRWPGEPPEKDYCVELRERMGPPRSASGASPSGGATSGPAKPVPR